MTTNENFDVYVCVDCGYYLANGEPDDGGEARAHGWDPADLERNWKGYHLTNGDSDKDHEFSSAQCDGCGSRLAGARMHCVAWECTAEEKEATVPELRS